MNYCCLKNKNCKYANLYGWCTSNACIKSSRITDLLMGSDNNEMVFPYTIGKITFNTKKELIDWVLMHQDEDYGIGNNA